MPGTPETTDCGPGAANDHMVSIPVEDLIRLKTEHSRFRVALTRLRDCDWTIGRGDRMDPVRDIARAALEGRDDRPHE